MKKIILILILCFTLGACTESVPSAEKQQAKQTTQALNEMNRQIGMPNIKNFFEKKMAKELFELRDNSNLITYAYTKNRDGKYVYIGACIGFGLPYAVQYTNPQKRDWVSREGGVGYLPQADPNGLYMPSGSSATWLMLINPETGKIEASYEESEITVRQSKIPRKQVMEWSLTEDY